MISLNRRRFLLGASVIAMGISPVHARFPRGTAPIVPQTVQGLDPSLTFANFLKLAQSQSNFGDADFPKYLDANGFPNLNSYGSSATNPIGGVVDVASTSTGSAVSWVLKWTGTGAFFFDVNTGGGVTITANSNATIVTNAFNLEVKNTTAGTPVRIEFQWISFPGNPLSYTFPLGQTYSSMAGLVLCRLSDEAAIDANANAINPDYVAQVKLLNPKVVRTLNLTGAISNGNPPAAFAYRAPTGSLSFGNNLWLPTLWTGTVSGTNTYTCSAPSGWPGLVNGATVQGLMTNANTSTTPTLNVGSSGAITIVNRFCGTLNSGDIGASSRGTFVYNDLLNQFIFYPDGINPAAPIEAQVLLANTLGVSFWYCLSPFFQNADCASVASYVQANLNSGLSCYFEYGNEMWNQSFSIWGFFNACGAALGFPNANNEQQLGASALRIRQAMAAITTAWGANSGLVRVMAFQAYAGTSVGNIDTYLYQGTDLNTALGYTKYNSYVAVTYTAVGQRPIDFCDVLSYATYYQGAQCADLDQHYQNPGGSGLTTGGPATGPGTSIAGLTGAADAYAAGGSTNIANAIGWLDWDFRQGTINGSNPADSGTLKDFDSLANVGLGATGVYPAWETMGAKYSKPIYCYEGGLQAVAPSTSECTTLGISTTYGGPGGKIDNLLTAYKQSSTFALLVTDQFNQFLGKYASSPNFGLLPHSKGPAWFGYAGPSQWSLMPGDIDTGPPVGSSQWTSFNAIGAFN